MQLGSGELRPWSEAQLVQGVTRLVDRGEEARGEIALEVAGGDAHVVDPEGGGEGMLHGVQPAARAVVGHQAHDPLADRGLAIDRAGPAQAGIVDLGPRADLVEEDYELGAQPREEPRDGGFFAARLVKVEEGVVARGAGSAARPGRSRGQAIGLPLLKLHHTLEVGREGGEVVLGPGLGPGGVGEARLEAELGHELGRELGLAVVGAPEDAQVASLALAEGRVAQGIRARGAEGREELGDLGRHEFLVGEALDVGELLGPLSDRLGGHVGLLVPAEEGVDMYEEAELAVELDEPLQFLAHGSLLIGFLEACWRG